MSALTLYRDMKKRGVHLQAAGGRLLVDAPAGELSGQDRAALAKAKPALLRLLAPKTDEGTADEGRRCGATVTSTHPSYVPRDDDERRLLAAGWEPKERMGLVIWANPETGFYCSQEVALHRLDAGRETDSRTFATKKSAGVMGSGESVADGRDGKP